jgi:hypothetical protein
MNDAKQTDRRNRRKKRFSFTRKKSLAHHDEIPNFQEAPMPSITITEIFRKF